MKKLEQWWKHRFLVEAGEGGEGGSGGGGGSGAGAGGEGAGDGGSADKGGTGAGGGGSGGAGDGAAGDGTGNAGAGGGAPAIPEETQKELARLKKLELSAAAHLEVDPATGEYKPKAKAVEPPARTPTQAELEEAARANQIAESAAALIEQNRDAETKTIDKFKAKDPLFSQNILKAREKVMGLPAAQRTPVVWERAYRMAMGETMETGSYEKHYREEGKKQAAEEFARQNDMVLPEGSGAGAGGSGSKKIDVSKITLTRAERDAAVKLIQGGFLNSIDEYKENMVREGIAEGVEA